MSNIDVDGVVGDVDLVVKAIDAVHVVIAVVVLVQYLHVMWNTGTIIVIMLSQGQVLLMDPVTSIINMPGKVFRKFIRFAFNDLITASDYLANIFH